MPGSNNTGFLPPASSEAAAASRRERVGLALRTLAERRRLIGLVVLAACAGTLLVSLAQEDEYEAKSALLVSQPETILGGTAPVDHERLVRTNLELIELGAVAERVRRSLRVRERSFTAQELLDQVNAHPLNDSDVIEIRARDRDPEVARDMANEFAAQYVDFRKDKARSSIEEAIERAESQLEDLEGEGGSASIRRGIERRLRDLELSAAQQSGNVDVVTRAELPGDPVSPRPLLATLVAFPLGLLGGVLLAGFVSMLDRRLKREEEVEAHTGLPVVTAVPRRPDSLPRRKGNGFWADPAEAEAYNRLATNLRFFNFDRSMGTVLVASAVPQEGKTTVTLRLAAALAGAGQGVLAIEADLRRPTFQQHFSIQFPQGLSGVLAGATPFDDVVTRVHTSYALAAPADDADDEAWTAAPFIEVVPAGVTPPNPAELLASNALAGVLGAARSRADVVLIDSAPLVPVGDAVPLANAVDGVLLVVQLGVSRRDEVRRALKLLGTLRSRVIGVVVTNAPRGDERYGYYGERPRPPAAPDALGPRHRARRGRRPAPRFEENGGSVQETQESDALDPENR